MPTIEILGPDEGDLFASGCEAIVVPVNCVGVAGKGLALTARRRLPEWCAEYRNECEGGHVEPGGVYCHVALATGRRPPTWVLSFATKDHWRNPSRIEWIERGLDALVAFMAGSHSPSVGIPALGCGYGGLPWDEVWPLIEAAARRMTAAERVVIFSPREGT